MPVTRFEDLPDEILLFYILPLFSLQESYHSFAHLNKKIDAILRSTKHLTFKVEERNQDDPALSFFASCLAQLHVFLGTYDIEPYRSLRSLKLEYPSALQRNAIRVETLPLLEDLQLCYPLTDAELLDRIFSNTFPFLHRCQFDRIQPSFTWSGSPNIRSLKVSVHGPIEFMCILKTCPLLTSLNVVVYPMSQSVCKPPTVSTICVHENLHSLMIVMKFRLFLQFIAVVPNLKRLIFRDYEIQFPSTVSTGPVLKPLGDSLRCLHQLQYLKCFVRRLELGEDLSAHRLFVHVEKSGRDLCVSSTLE